MAKSSTRYKKAGVLPYRVTRKGNIEVLVISSRTYPSSWILPMGTVENGESVEAAAARECVEESGFSVLIESKLGVVNLKSAGARVQFFLGPVVGATTSWENGRRRKWVKLPQLLAHLAPPFRSVGKKAQKLLQARQPKQK